MVLRPEILRAAQPNDPPARKLPHHPSIAIIGHNLTACAAVGQGGEAASRDLVVGQHVSAVDSVLLGDIVQVCHVHSP